MDLPGEYDAASQTWAFPPLEYPDAKGNTRQTRIFAKIKKKDGSGPSEEEWKGSAFSGSAEYWTVTGLAGGAPVKSAPTIVVKGKNLGKSNQTNAWTQALREAASRWKKAANKRDDAGYVVPPMLLTAYEEPPKEWPQYVQEKLDGVRAMVYAWNPEVKEKLQLAPPDVEKAVRAGAVVVSRTLKLVPAWQIAAAASAFLASHPRAAVDGELVAYNEQGELLPLQEISGMSRNVATAEKLSMAVFDVYDGDDPRRPFEDRLALAHSPLLRQPPLLAVTTSLAATFEEANEMHEKHLEAGLEGSVLRLPSGVYTPSFNNHRSKQVIKWKPRHSAEFRCVDFTAGQNGKAEGAIMWIIEVPGRRERKNVKMAVDPIMKLEDRKALYQRLSANPRAFNKEFANRALTVEFFDWSEDGLPTQAKAVAFREWDEVAN